MLPFCCIGDKILSYFTKEVVLMANYAARTSDRKKKDALRWWAIGCLGIFGLENFYVGKIKKGSIRIVIGFFALMCIISLLIPQTDDIPFPAKLFSILLIWAILGLPNFIKLKLGTFRDNVGAPVRE